MISKRGLAAAAATGASLVILATGTASACTIDNFSDSGACNSSTGKAVITVSNADYSLTGATLTVYVTGTQAPVGTATLAQGSRSVDVSVPWISGGSWTVQVDTDHYFRGQDLQPVVVPQTPCGQVGTPTSSPSPTTPAPSPTTPAASATPKPSAGASSTTVAVVATSAPASASPTAMLAETGSSGTGMLATFAGVLVAAGGGALYFLRRSPAGRRG